MSNIYFTFFLSLVLIGTDFLVNLFYPNFYIYSSKFTIQEIIITIVLSLLISFLSKINRVFFSLLLILFSFSQVVFFIFFHSYIQYYHIQLLFTEYSDIIDALSFGLISHIVIIIIFIFLIIVFINMYINRKFKFQTYKQINRFFYILLISLPIMTAIKPKIFLVTPIHFSYINTIFSLSFAIKENLKFKIKGDFKSYIIERSNEGEQNIIVIMGESLSSKRMGLFGYRLTNQSNTPNLDRLKNNLNFFYAQAISSGVNTPVSILSFFNIKREPENMELIYSEKTNLLKLAKDNGYKTFWFSTQEEGSSISTILKYAETIKVRKDYIKPVFDDMLLEDLKKIDFSKKNFIVLHFRANHSPYAKYIRDEFNNIDYSDMDYHTYKISSYNQSILYIDTVLNDIFNYLKDKKFTLYFTSDHGERLGYVDDDFKYGHSQLNYEVAKVPFIIYSDKEIQFTHKLYTHYEIGKLIARNMGYNIINPNDNNKTYYINGVNINGEAGFLTLEYHIK